MVTPLELPFNLFPFKDGGPYLPTDWKLRTHSINKDFSRHVGTTTSLQDDDPWENKRSETWVTSLVAWQEIDEVKTENDGPAERQTSPSPAGLLGLQLAAFGTCEGTVWILRDARSAQTIPGSPIGEGLRSLTSKPAAPVLPSARFATRASSPTPSHASSKRHGSSQSMSHAAPLFAGFSPSASSFGGDYEVNEAQPLPMRVQDAPVRGEVARGEDAESLLEAQFHAGERKGLMGALGLSHSPAHHAHTPRLNEAAPRSRRPSIPVVPSLDRSYASSQSLHALTQSRSEINASPQEPLRQLCPHVALQGPSRSKVVGLGPCKEGLLVLQASGSLALWSAHGELISSTFLAVPQQAQPHRNLGPSAHNSLRERKVRTPGALAGLPSFMPGVEVRAMSDTIAPSTMSEATASFSELRSVVDASRSLWCAWDTARQLAFVVRPSRQHMEIRWIYCLPSAASPPAARVLTDGHVEFLWLDSSGVLHSEAVPPQAQPDALQGEEERVRGTLEAAAAFFRRNLEGEILHEAADPLAVGSSPESRGVAQPAVHLMVQPAASSLPSGSSSPGLHGGFASGAAALFRREVSSSTPLPQPQVRSRQWEVNLIEGLPARKLGIREDGTLELWNERATVMLEMSEVLETVNTEILPLSVPVMQLGMSRSRLCTLEQYFVRSSLDLSDLQAVSHLADGTPFCVTANTRLAVHSSHGELWRSRSPNERATVALPLSLERIVYASPTGEIHCASLGDIVRHRTRLDVAETGPDTDMRFEYIRSISNPRTNSKHVLAGSREGDIVICDAVKLNIQARWSAFSSPVHSALPLQSLNSTSRLHGCVIVIALDGTLAILLLDGLKLLHLVPGRGVQLERVATRGDELLLQYADGRARVWDMRTYELRRSIGREQVDALVAEGEAAWWSVRLDGMELGSSRDRIATAAVLASPPRNGFSSTCVVANVRRAVEAATAVASAALPHASHETGQDDQPVPTSRSAQASSTTLSLASPAGERILSILRPLLTQLIPFGMDLSLDALAEQLLGAGWVQKDRTTGLGYYSSGHISLDGSLTSGQAFCLSGVRTTQRVLAIVAILHVLARIHDITFQASSLSALIIERLSTFIGSKFAPPSLPTLAPFLVDPSKELSRAARALCTSTLSSMSQFDVQALCDEWHSLLPSQQGNAADARAPLATSLLGFVAIERYKELSPTLLKDVATSIFSYLADEREPSHQAIAIELCSFGFVIWQHYLDAMEVVRSLFALATSKDASGDAQGSNRGIARQATLQIAADNTPLFMTTLSLDILHARSPAHCSATMRLVAFMVRRKPLILYPNLPRLAEAVVKSLDPTVTALREAVVQAATVMISELVQTYPSIAFHTNLQRLAVGTHEGALVMYDLKTATRLYVIEGHRGQLSACDFSPDGRRLVTVSLAEGKALIWKVGSSLTSFFTPGSLPRQGSTNDSGAYKAMEFNVGAHAPADVLRGVSFDWQGDHGVRLNVGEASLTFSVA